MTRPQTPADVPVAPTSDSTIDAPEGARGNAKTFVAAAGEGAPKARVSGGSAEDVQDVNLDDDEIYSGRGNNARRGGTDKAQGADSGRLGSPTEQLSRSNGPSDRGTR